MIRRGFVQISRWVTLSAALLLTAAASGPAWADSYLDSVSSELERLLDPANNSLSEFVLDWDRLEAFYKPRGFVPVWVNGRGALPRARLFRQTLKDAPTEGLDPRPYHLPKIARLWRSASARKQATLELLLTDAFLQYSRHVRAGRLKPQEADPEWHIKPPQIKEDQFAWLTLPDKELAGAIQAMPPPHEGYRQLRDALARYRDIEKTGGWPPIPPGPRLELGDRHRQLGLLRLRLLAEGDLDIATLDDPRRFDRTTSEAVIRFQKRHGLEADGVLGDATRKAMSVPVAARIRQIKLNMERWRWLPRELGERYVMVNTAGYTLEVKQDRQTVMSLRVITGQKEHETPVIGSKLVTVQINPHWVVPPTIAAEELLPKQQKNPKYFSSRGFRVFSGWGENAKELNPSRIRWSRFNAKNFPFKLVQDPGPRNALGRIKFIFANDFAIYLHDTPYRRLFDQETRALSFGCIRVESPLDLVVYLLGGEDGWTREHIQEVIDAGETVNVRLPEAIPLYLVYLTTWVGPDNQVNFREDIYERDSHMTENTDDRRIKACISTDSTPDHTELSAR